MFHQFLSGIVLALQRRKDSINENHVLTMIQFGYPLKAGHQMPQWLQASKAVAPKDARRF